MTAPGAPPSPPGTRSLARSPPPVPVQAVGVAAARCPHPTLGAGRDLGSAGEPGAWSPDGGDRVGSVPRVLGPGEEGERRDDCSLPRAFQISFCGLGRSIMCICPGRSSVREADPEGSRNSPQGSRAPAWRRVRPERAAAPGPGLAGSSGLGRLLRQQRGALGFCSRPEFGDTWRKGGI